MGLFEKLRLKGSSTPTEAKPELPKPRLEGYQDGEVRVLFDETLGRDAEMDTRIFLRNEAQWLLEISRTQVSQWLHYEKEGLVDTLALFDDPPDK